MNKLTLWAVVVIILISLIMGYFLLNNTEEAVHAKNNNSLHLPEKKPASFPKTNVKGSFPLQSSQAEKEALTLYLKNIERLLFRDGEAGEMDAQKVNKRMAELSKLLENTNASNIHLIVALFEENGITENSSHDQMNELMKAWAHFDGSAAVDYALTQMPEGIGGRSALTALGNWNEFTLEGGESFYTQVPKYLQNEYVNIMVTKEWQDKPDKVLDWAESIADSKIKNEAIQSLMENWSQENGQQAAEWLAANTPLDKTGYSIVPLVGNWMKQDPENAMQWALSLPENEYTKEAVSYGFVTWAEHDPASAGKMLNQLPQSPRLDQAVYDYTLSVASKEPEIAMGWAESIHDPSKRIASMTQVATAWYQKDKASALQWMETSDLPKVNRQIVIEGGDVGFSEY